MSHGRIVCECGEVLSSCRCPGPHVDTVGKTPCPHRNPKCKPSDDPKDREISLLRTALTAAQERERVMREAISTYLNDVYGPDYDPAPKYRNKHWVAFKAALTPKGE